MARRIATLADVQAIANAYLANRPDLAAKVASGDFVPVEHIRRKLSDPNVLAAYDTSGGVVSLRHLPGEGVVFELGGFQALGAAARRALWALAKDTWRSRLADDTILLQVSCREGDQVDTFLVSRVPGLRQVQSTIGTPNEMPGPQPVIYQTTLGAAL